MESMTEPGRDLCAAVCMLCLLATHTVVGLRPIPKEQSQEAVPPARPTLHHRMHPHGIADCVQ